MTTSLSSDDITYLPETHQYFRGLKQLASVTTVLRSTWPVKPDFSAADSGVIENARERGSDTDALFSAYVNGTLTEIPAGTRLDVYNPEPPHDGLLQKLMKWWDKSPVYRNGASAQVILADDEVAGTCDVLTRRHETADPNILTAPTILDVKCTYDIEPTYPIQLGLYGLLYEAMYGVLPLMGIVHVTKRFAEPKVIAVGPEAIDDAITVRAMWRMVNRRGGFAK